MSDVFLSYSRRDQEVVRRLHAALAEAGREAWVDWQGIPPTAEWMAEVRAAVDAADAFVVVLSPDWAASPVCREEAGHAAARGKRIVPVVVRDTDPASVAERVAAVNWVFLRDGDDFDAGVATLITALDLDLDWVHGHTRLLVRAGEWEARGRDRSLLLRGRDLQAAEALLASAGADRDPRLTPLQGEYLLASREAERRSGRIRTGVLAAAMVGALILAGFALVQLFRAEDQTRVARQQQTVAETQRGIADSRELAQAALAQLETDPELSMLLSLRALEVMRTQEADQALRRATQASHVRRRVSTTLEAWPLALSADGTRLLSGDADGVTSLVSLGETAATDVRRLGVAAESFDGLITPDGMHGASLAAGNIALWDFAVGDGPAVLNTGMPNAFGLALDGDGSRVAVGGPEGALQVWDVASRESIRTIRSGDFDLPAVALSRDGDLVAAAGWDRAVRIWDVATGDLVSTLRGHTLLILAIAFSPDGRLLVSGGHDPIVRTWNVATGDALAELRGHTAPVTTVSFDSTGREVLSAGEDGTARLWDALTGRSLEVLRGNLGTIAIGQFGPTPGELSTVSGDGTVRVWARDASRPIATATGHDGEIWQVDVEASGERFVTASIDHTARVWRTADGTPVSTLRGHSGEVATAAFRPDGAHVVTGGLDGSIRIWDPVTGAQERLLADDLMGAWRVAYSPDGTRIAAAGASGTGIWDADTGERLMVRDAPSYTVAFSPDGGRLVLDAGDTSAEVVDAASGQTLLSLDGHSAYVSDAGFDPTGTRLVTASADGTTRVWDASSGTSLLELRTSADAGTVYSAKFSPDGARVLTGQDDGIASVWDSTSGELLTTYQADSQRVPSAVFSPDGRAVIAAGTGDLAARVFACELCGSTDDVIAIATARLTRALSQEERSLYLHEQVVIIATAEPSMLASLPAASQAPSAGASEAPSLLASPSPGPVSLPSSAPSPPPDPLGAALCAGRRSSCELSEGRYHAPDFRPPLSFAVEEGWQNEYEAPRTIWVARPDDGSSLTIYSDPTDGLLAGRVVPIEPGPTGVLDLVRRQFGLRVGEPVRTQVDGFDAIAFDVANELGSAIEVLQVDEGSQVLVAEQHDRWIVADIRGTTVLIIESIVDPSQFGARQPELQRIVDSIDFDAVAPSPGSSPGP